MHDEPWQVFSENGDPVSGKSASRNDFQNDTSLVMAAAHVWFWRRCGDNSFELLLQKRADELRSWPGYFDITVAGHVDAGELAVESAVRECREEINADISPTDLYYIFSLRTPVAKKELDIVYIHEVKKDQQFRFDDGEVTELRWLSLLEFEKWIDNPQNYNLVPQGNEYFNLLLKNIRRFIDENK